MSDRQEVLDRFYHTHGHCCAGCDWWRHLNSMVGECTKSAPAPGSERLGMLEIYRSSVEPEAGHALTPRGHSCGEFMDEFNWASLPLPYRLRVGAPT